MRDIKGYEGLYSINEEGDIFSLPKLVKRKDGNITFFKHQGKILSGAIASNGYRVVNLYKNKKRKTVTVHRLVAKTFLENHKNHPCINHKDGNKLNNNYKNLEWCSYKYNLNEAMKMGFRNFKYLRRLSDSQVKDIRKDYSTGKFFLKDLAIKYGVGISTISDTINNRRRKYLKVTNEPEGEVR